MHRFDDHRAAAFVHADDKVLLAPLLRVWANIERIHFVEPRYEVM